jgi:hypothetical protein
MPRTKSCFLESRSVVTANPPDADALATAKAKVESCRAELKQAIGELKALKTEADDDMSAQAGRVILDHGADICIMAYETGRLLLQPQHNVPCECLSLQIDLVGDTSPHGSAIALQPVAEKISWFLNSEQIAKPSGDVAKKVQHLTQQKVPTVTGMMLMKLHPVVQDSWALPGVG